MKRLTNEQAEIIMAAAKKITYKALKTIEGKGNPRAAEILNTYQHPILDDLCQAVIVRAVEMSDALVWTLPNDANDAQIADVSYLGYTFADYYHDGKKWRNENKRYIFQAVQNELYSLVQKAYKREFIPVFTEDENGNVVETQAMVTAALQAHRNSLDNAHVQELIEDLRGLLTEKQNKVLTLLIEGYKHKEIAVIMGVSRQAVEKLIQCIKKEFVVLNSQE